MSCKTTHHHACDCREAYFKSLEAKNKRFIEVLNKIVGTLAGSEDENPLIIAHLRLLAARALKGKE